MSSLRPLSAPISRSSYYGWVPKTNEVHNKFILDLINDAKTSPERTRPQCVTDFDNALSQDQKNLFTKALEEVRIYYKKWADPESIVKDYAAFLDLLDGIVVSTPRFYKANVNGVTIGEPVGLPLYFLLDLISNTSAAYILFTQQTFNDALKGLLTCWGNFLKDKASGATLPEWFSTEALQLLESGLGGESFDDTFETQLPAPQRYVSWDSFFTRQFKNVTKDRPIDYPPAGSAFSFFYNSSESTVLRTVTGVLAHDTFWLKTQNYSLSDVLGGLADSSGNLYSDLLEGSSAYQAFLSPADYHRWHSPMKGQVVAHNVIQGSYYAVLPDSGAPEYDPDLVPGDPHGAIVRSQAWLSSSATRAVFILKPTDTTSPIELAAVVQIGMGEVSSCEVTYNVKDGQTIPDPINVDIGSELGMFHFGGSSYVVFVLPKAGYKLVFQDIVNSPIRPGQHRWVNSVIGQFWPVSN